MPHLDAPQDKSTVFRLSTRANQRRDCSQQSFPGGRAKRTFKSYLHPVLGHLRRGPREPHFEQAPRDPPPAPLPRRGRMFPFDCSHKQERRRSSAAEKRWVGHERSRHRTRMRESETASRRPRAMRAGSARLHGQSWRGSSVPASAWRNRHGRAGDRLEWPTLCPAPSTPLTISRWSGSRQQAMLSPS